MPLFSFPITGLRHHDFAGRLDELHAHGVKVLLPFIPWDRHEHEGTDSMGSELARLAADTGFDGLHLDTMKMFPHSAREKLDAVRPGIVLETQGHPMKKRSTSIALRRAGLPPGKSS